MNKFMKKHLDQEYEEIAKNLYIEWKKRTTILPEELIMEGISNSGVVEHRYILEAKVILNRAIDKISMLFEKTQKEYNRNIKLKDLYDWNINIQNLVVGFIEEVEADIPNIIKRQLCETSKIEIKNMMDNTKNQVKNIFMRISDGNKGRKLDLSICMSIISLVLSILSILINLIFNILELLI